MPPFVDFFKKMNGKFFKKNKIFTMSRVALLLVLSVFLLPGKTFSQELQSVEETVENIQGIYEEIKDLKADFIQEVTIKSVKKSQKEEGRVFFKNPRNMLWDYKKPQGKKLVINSQTAWLYLAGEKVAYKQKAESIFQSKLLINFFSGTGKLKDDFIIKYAEPEALDKDGNYLLVLIPREKTAACKSARLIVDKNNYYILQISFNDFLGNDTRLKFSNISVNIGVDRKIFQFKPPAGVEIFEMP